MEEYNTTEMKFSRILSVVLSALSLMASPLVSLALPLVVHADTETTTNVPFHSALDVSGRFSFTLSCRATPSRLEATADDSPVFADLPLESVHDRSWNLLRLTGRGLDASLENFTVSVTPDGTVFIMR